MSNLREIVAKFQSEVPHFISTDIVSLETGLSLAGGSIDPNFDSSIASACYVEVFQSNSQALELLGIGGETCEDILFSMRDAYLLQRGIGTEHYHGLAITRSGSLGYARTLMRKYEHLILDAIKADIGG